MFKKQKTHIISAQNYISICIYITLYNINGKKASTLQKLNTQQHLLLKNDIIKVMDIIELKIGIREIKEPRRVNYGW